MTDTILVTGVSGFLGGHVALYLLNAGYRVRGSVRNLERAPHIRETLARQGANVENLEFVALDLLRDDGWDTAMQDIRFIHHVASPFVLAMPKDKMELIRPAVAGTERALRAALNANVERIILTSSMAAIAYGHSRSRTTPFTEADWTDPDSPDINAYIESKTRAEARAWELMREAGRESDLVAINPSGIFGPLLDNDPGTTGELIQRLMNGSTPAAPDLELHVVDVRDVAELHLNAMRNTQAGGKRLLASSGDLTLLTAAQLLAAHFPAFARKTPRFALPDWAVRIYALFDSDVRSVLGDLGVRKTLDTTAATALLGHDMIPANDAIIATAQSLIAEKLI